MKHFLLKVILCVLLPIILCHVLFLGVYEIVAMGVDRKLSAIGHEYSVLIMGDSQMEKISPEILGPGAINIATSGEHYYFTYTKLKKIIGRKGHTVRCVVLGVSVHNFSPMFVNKFTLDKPEGKTSLKDYLYFFNLLNNDFCTPQQLLLNREYFLGILLGPVWGGFDATNEKDPAIPFVDLRLKDIYVRPVDPKLINTFWQEFYLGKIADLCKSENIHLVLISTPVHVYYRQHVEQTYLDRLQIAVDEHKDLLYLNYLDDEVPGDYMSDPNHMNNIGAEIYSTKLNDELRSHNFVPQ